MPIIGSFYALVLHLSYAGNICIVHSEQETILNSYITHFLTFSLFIDGKWFECNKFIDS